MLQEKLNRINELARIAKQRSLTPEEQQERDVLRKEYIAEWRKGAMDVLDNLVIQTPDGKKQVKRILAKGYNHSVEHPEAKSAQTCVFVKDCPDDAAVKFTVTPMNCFGERGRELTLTCSATPSV